MIGHPAEKDRHPQDPGISICSGFEPGISARMRFSRDTPLLPKDSPGLCRFCPV